VRTRGRIGLAGALLALLLVVPGQVISAGPAVDRSDRAAIKDRTITAKGVGKVRLGARYAKLRRAGLVGPMREGCELSGAGSARLKAPLRGSVEFKRPTRRARAKVITVIGGATANGVGVGAKRDEIEAAFPHARFDRSTEEVFGVTRVRIPKRDGGRIEMTLSVDSGKVSAIYVPRISFCE